MLTKVIISIEKSHDPDELGPLDICVDVYTPEGTNDYYSFRGNLSMVQGLCSLFIMFPNVRVIFMDARKYHDKCAEFDMIDEDRDGSFSKLAEQKLDAYNQDLRKLFMEETEDDKKD